MGTVGVLLILLGVSVLWLLGIKGMTPDQAIQDVQSTVGLGQNFVAVQPLPNQGQGQA